MQAPILGIAGPSEPTHIVKTASRLSAAQAATLEAIISHAAHCGLPLPTDDFMFPEQGASLVLPVANVDEVAAWCRAFQDDDQHAAVLTDKAGHLTMWWTGGMFLDVPVIIRAEAVAA